jgi:hypothetical protein
MYRAMLVRMVRWEWAVRVYIFAGTRLNIASQKTN